MVLATQPIVDLARGTVTGYEVLARFSHGGRPARPEQVFATASANGFGAELDAAVIRRGLELARGRPENCFVTLNVDPHHIDDPPVREVLDAHGDLGGIVFELFEQRPIYDLFAARRSLDGLRRRGAMIAIDDRGAGYADLDRLVELGPQIVKLERGLVMDLHVSEAKRAVVRMLGDLADRLDAWVLAEGIESEEELRAVADLGVPLGQGFVLGEPAPAWAPAAPQVATARSHAPPTTPGGALHSIMEMPPTCHGEEDWPRGAALAVRLDAASRPIEMRLVTHDGWHLRLEYDLLRVNPATPIASVALRVAARPDRLRWDPVVCIDARGRLLGVAYAERMMQALADEVLVRGEGRGLPG